jgi:hypothetical protein
MAFNYDVIIAGILDKAKSQKDINFTGRDDAPFIKEVAHEWGDYTNKNDLGNFTLTFKDGAKVKIDMCIIQEAVNETKNVGSVGGEMVRRMIQQYEESIGMK